eukprot:jgi/Phyca11/17059/fgenesh1_pg.PHYCAscaffold_24_\
MRLLFAVVLILAACLAAADVPALNDAPSKRLLRSTVRVDEEEERGAWDTLSNKFAKVILKPNQFAVRNMDDPKVAKAAKTTLLKTFKSVDPQKFNSVENFFRGKAFNNLENYVLRLNKQDINKQTSVAKLLTQWAVEGKTSAEVTKLFPKGLGANYYLHLENKYSGILMDLARDSQKRATRLAKLERARAAATTTFTRVPVEMLDVEAVGSDLPRAEQDETMEDLAFFLDNFGSTQAVRIKLQEQEKDIKRLEKKVRRLLIGQGMADAAQEEEDRDSGRHSSTNDEEDVSTIMTNLHFFLQTFGSTRARTTQSRYRQSQV